MDTCCRGSAATITLGYSQVISCQAEINKIGGNGLVGIHDDRSGCRIGISHITAPLDKFPPGVGDSRNTHFGSREVRVLTYHWGSTAAVACSQSQGMGYQAETGGQIFFTDVSDISMETQY